MSEHPARDVAVEPTVSGPQPEAAVSEAPGTSTAIFASQPSLVLSVEQRALLTAALDRIVPPNGKLPGAGGLGVAATIDRMLAQTPALRRLFLDGLTEIEVTSQRQAGQPFAALDSVAQESVLRTVEAAAPAFFAALVSHAYRGYYTDSRVHAAVGYPVRPPQPLGHDLAPFHEELLQGQRGRLPFWRPTT